MCMAISLHIDNQVRASENGKKLAHRKFSAMIGSRLLKVAMK